MRLILTAIILTMLSQPVWAETTEGMYRDCKSWQAKGFDSAFAVTSDGMFALQCYEYMSAMADVGGQHCNQWDVNASFKWDATAKQLAQFFINKAEAQPELWGHTPYVVIIVGSASELFPCKK